MSNMRILGMGRKIFAILEASYFFIFCKVYRITHAKSVDISSIYTIVTSGHGKIPRRVYQTWKSPVLPSLHALGVKRFRKLNPDYSFLLFDDAQMADYMRVNFTFHPILQVFEQIQIPAAKADIWRYCILFREGGIYCDIDSALSVPFRQIIEDNFTELLSFEANLWNDQLDVGSYADPSIFLNGPPDSIRESLQFPDNTILNWLLCFQKESPILEEVINLIVRHFDYFKEREFENVWKAVIHSTGPLAFTQAIWTWMARTKKRPIQCGIDFDRHGIFKLPGSGDHYVSSPHYRSMRNTSLSARKV